LTGSRAIPRWVYCRRVSSRTSPQAGSLRARTRSGIASAALAFQKGPPRQGWGAWDAPSTMRIRRDHRGQVGCSGALHHPHPELTPSKPESANFGRRGRPEVAVARPCTPGTRLVRGTDALLRDELRSAHVLNELAHLIALPHDGPTMRTGDEHEEPFAAAVARAPGSGEVVPGTETVSHGYSAALSCVPASNPEGGRREEGERVREGQWLSHGPRCPGESAPRSSSGPRVCVGVVKRNAFFSRHNSRVGGGVATPFTPRPVRRSGGGTVLVLEMARGLGYIRLIRPRTRALP
jgi:hypothetical protein